MNFSFLAKTELFYWLRIQCTYLNFFESCLIFLSSISFKTNGHENSNFEYFLRDLHNNTSKFFESLGLYRNLKLPFSIQKSKIDYGIKMLQFALTASFFENGPMLTPTKSWKTTIVGSGDLDSAQWSHPNRFYRWRS